MGAGIVDSICRSPRFLRRGEGKKRYANESARLRRILRQVSSRIGSNTFGHSVATNVMPSLPVFSVN